ncbi:MAG: carboxypeptidase regulatory-like domain-containing protein, partial [Polyangiaceae bacterium]|nr:carboxypeptidase regulatory-like domain-containing protein [Polyangiaceae bacterium]
DAVVGGGIASTGFGRAVLSHQVHGPSLLESGGALGVTLGQVPRIPLDGDLGLGAVSIGGAASGPTTDARGRFRIDGVAPGTVQVRVQHAPHAPALTAPLRVGPGELREGLRIVLPDGGEVAGRVVDSSGYPVGSVIVTLHAEREPTPRTVVAGDDGTFAFSGVLGAAVLTALPIDQPAARSRITVRSGDRLEVDLVLATDLGDLRGRVRDPRDFPVAGARVSLVSLRSSAPFERSTFTADDGTFHFPAVPRPPLQVTVDHPAYASQQRPVRDLDAELSVVLDPGAAVVGTVVDERSGEPVEGARVTLRRGGQVLVERVTGRTGTFRAERITPGPLSIEATSTAHVSSRVDRTLSASRYGDGELDVGTMRLPSAGRVSGRILDSRGDPVPGADVFLEGARGA